MHSNPQDGEGDVASTGATPSIPQVPEVIRPGPRDGEWDVVSKAIHDESRRMGGNPFDAEEDAQDALTIGWAKRDLFDPSRGASRTTLIKEYRRKVAANNRRLRARRSLRPLLDFDGPSGGQSGEYMALNREWRDTVALAGNNAYGGSKIGPDVRMAVVLTIAGEPQEAIAARLGIARSNTVAGKLLRFRRRFEEEMRREAIGGCIELEDLYCCCAAENRDNGRPPDFGEFRRHDPIAVGLERVPQDVDRILELIANDRDITMFVRDVVADRLAAISEIAVSQLGAGQAVPQLVGDELDIARTAVCLVLLSLPSLAHVPSLASFADQVGIEVAGD